jgi:hypothetical protein
VCAGALPTNCAAELTSSAPDEASTLACDCLSDYRSYDSTACVPSHTAGDGGSHAGGRGLGGSHARGTSATRGLGAAASCLRARERMRGRGASAD